MSLRARARIAEWVHRYWSGEMNWAGRAADAVLAPAEASFRGAVALRGAAYDRKWLTVRSAPVPVISVGNLAVGGSGKTPFTAWLAARLSRSGRRPAVLLRGYGGDEVLLHRELSPAVPVFANPDRLASAGAAVAAGCDMVILDDGFQHRKLDRDLDIVLVAMGMWRRGIRLLPRGPWRESAKSLRRADVVVVVSRCEREAALGEVAAELERVSERPTIQCRITLSELSALHGAGKPSLPISSIRGCSVLAVASVADPHSFQRNLSDAGAKVELIPFPDHHSYSREDADELTAASAGRPIVMTHKDAVKLRPLIDSSVSAWIVSQRVHIVRGLQSLDEQINRALHRGAA